MHTFHFTHLCQHCIFSKLIFFFPSEAYCVAYSGWPWTCNLTTSSSWVRITSMSHHDSLPFWTVREWLFFEIKSCCEWWPMLNILAFSGLKRLPKLRLASVILETLPEKKQNGLINSKAEIKSFHFLASRSSVASQSVWWPFCYPHRSTVPTSVPPAFSCLLHRTCSFIH